MIAAVIVFWLLFSFGLTALLTWDPFADDPWHDWRWKR